LGDIGIDINIHIPDWLGRILIWFVLAYRRARYGYPFRRIPLTMGKFAIVDPEDYEHLSRYKWYVTKNGNTFYAKRNTSRKNIKNSLTCYMHRHIIKVPPGFVIDHINHNGLDNRKVNLRIATRAQNNRHTKKTKNKFRSNYKGIYWHNRDRAWEVRITADGKRRHFGCYKDEIEAAKAYDHAAKIYHGSFAGLNFPE
jgi:hypothetical protein